MSGDAFLVELRPAPSGSGFIVSARLRVLSWEQVGKDRLPRTMFGTVSRSAFIPTRSGLAAVESRDSQGHRVFSSPLAPRAGPMRERMVRHLLRRCAAGAFDLRPYTATDWAEFQRRNPKERHANNT